MYTAEAEHKKGDEALRRRKMEALDPKSLLKPPTVNVLGSPRSSPRDGMKKKRSSTLSSLTPVQVHFGEPKESSAKQQQQQQQQQQSQSSQDLHARKSERLVKPAAPGSPTSDPSLSLTQRRQRPLDLSQAEAAGSPLRVFSLVMLFMALGFVIMKAFK